MNARNEQPVHSQMQRFSTEAVPRSAKLSYWHRVHFRHSEVLTFKQIAGREFEAECVSGALGPLSVRRTTSGPVRIEVTADTTKRASTRRYFVLMPTSGTLHVRYNNLECALGAGDFILLDSWSPSIVQIDAMNESVTVGIPPSALASHLPEAEYVAGIPIRGDHGVGMLASNMLRGVATALEGGLTAETGYRLANCLLEVIATSYLSEQARGYSPYGRSALNRVRAKRVVEQLLHEPRLTPQIVADKLGISARYLRMLFEEEGEPMSRYILRRRLERCAEHLQHGASHNKTLTTIAFSHGFSSMAHFARVFREHFGMTAGHFRAAHTLADAGTIIAAITDGLPKCVNDGSNVAVGEPVGSQA